MDFPVKGNYITKRMRKPLHEVYESTQGTAIRVSWRVCAFYRREAMVPVFQQYDQYHFLRITMGQHDKILSMLRYCNASCYENNLIGNQSKIQILRIPLLQPYNNITTKPHMYSVDKWFPKKTDRKLLIHWKWAGFPINTFYNWKGYQLFMGSAKTVITRSLRSRMDIYK